MIFLAAGLFHWRFKLTKSIEYVKYNSLLKRVLITGILMLSMSAMLGAETRLFLLRGNTLHIFNGSDGSELDRQRLETQMNASYDMLVGTPGGKYIFVIDSASGQGLALDFEDSSVRKTVDLSSAAPLSAAVFSPMGDVLYIVQQSSGQVISYTHRAGELGAEETFLSSDVSSNRSLPALNSRGTRFYISGEEGLLYYLVSDRSVIRVIRNISEGLDWTMAPGGRFLWGSGEEGWVVVDEQRGRVAARLPSGSSESPVFSSNGRTGWALTESGTVLVELDSRRNRILRREALNEALTGPATGSADEIWLAGEDALYLSRGGEAVQTSGSIAGSGEIKAFVSVTLRPGEGFACF